MTINLRDFYPWYQYDELIEVSNAVAEELLADQRYEKSYWRRLRRHKAQYSLDAGDGIENEACYINMTPQEIFEHELLRCHVCQALNALTETQGRRVEAYFLRGISQTAIAQAEGVTLSAVSQSVRHGVADMRKYLSNPR
jgi:RNA polymerase sigma-70 factor (ECF subfamily)